MNPKVDFFFDKAKQWQKEFEKLRTIAQETSLNEELKWGCPCYTYHEKNIFLIHGFKEYCAILFFKGALLNDTHSILIQQTENVQAARQLRFTTLQEIVDLEKIIKTYIYEAVEVEKSGIKVEMKETKQFEIPEEFKEKLEGNSALKEAFENLTPGRQRAYLLYFSSAKQSKTRGIRIEKYIPQIIIGKGIND